jgi:hypothetical protein
MLSVNRAILGLWWLVGLNIVGGFFAWLLGVLALFDSVDEDLWWEANGLSMMGFGILVLVVTLATSAIVGSNRERAGGNSG